MAGKNILAEIMDKTKISCDDPFSARNLANMARRRIYLYGEICDFDEEECPPIDKISAAEVVQAILEYNREDEELEVSERKPVILYIDSPGGDIAEGMALVSAIETSKTPIYTVNVGQWCSMAFLIGICGHKRFSLPRMTFLMHDGSSMLWGTSSKLQDTAEYLKRVKDEVIRDIVMKHSVMTPEVYQKNERVEFYMQPQEALEFQFIDRIIGTLDEVL